jgi:CRP/FNR family transcriptional regulator
MKRPHPLCQTCDLRANNLFTVLKGDQITRLDRDKTVREYNRGDVIFYEGTPSFAIYCIHYGWVKLYKVGSRAERQVIRLLGAGDVMGHRALLAGEPYASTAEVVDTTCICTIPKEPFLKMLTESPQLSMRLMTRLALELRESEEQTLILSHKSVQQRIAQLLLMLVKRTPHSTAEIIDIKIPLRRSEMAQMIGTTPETLSRTLRDFAKREILRVTRTDLSVLNLAELQKLAGSTDDL